MQEVQYLYGSERYLDNSIDGLQMHCRTDLQAAITLIRDCLGVRRPPIFLLIVQYLNRLEVAHAQILLITIAIAALCPKR